VIFSRSSETNHGGLADFHRKGQREITLGKEEKENLQEQGKAWIFCPQRAASWFLKQR